MKGKQVGEKYHRIILWAKFSHVGKIKPTFPQGIRELEKYSSYSGI